MGLSFHIRKVSDHAIVPLRPAPNQDHDVFCSEDVVIPAHGTGLVKTGLALSGADGTYLRIIPDASHRSLSGPIINKIDAKELDITVFNHCFEEVKIRRGDRVARVIVVAHAEFKVIDDIIDTEDWIAKINDTTDFKRIITETQTIFYVCSRAEHQKLSTSCYIWNALLRLVKHVRSAEYTNDKQVCLAIGCRDLQGATAIIIDVNIRANEKLEYLKDLPLYYVDLDTKKCLSAQNALASCADDLSYIGEKSDYLF